MKRLLTVLSVLLLVLAMTAGAFADSVSDALEAAASMSNEELYA